MAGDPLRDIMKRLEHARKPPWQLQYCGSGKSAPFSPGVIAALTRILDLMPRVGHLTLKTDAGAIHVSRDFPGHSTAEVNKKIAEIFASDPEITAIEFPTHTATRDDAHSHPDAKAVVRWGRG